MFYRKHVRVAARGGVTDAGAGAVRGGAGSQEAAKGQTHHENQVAQHRLKRSEFKRTALGRGWRAATAGGRPPDGGLPRRSFPQNLESAARHFSQQRLA